MKDVYAGDIAVAPEGRRRVMWNFAGFKIREAESAERRLIAINTLKLARSSSGITGAYRTRLARSEVEDRAGQ